LFFLLIIIRLVLLLEIKILILIFINNFIIFQVTHFIKIYSLLLILYLKIRFQLKMRCINSIKVLIRNHTLIRLSCNHAQIRTRITIIQNISICLFPNMMRCNMIYICRNIMCCLNRRRQMTLIRFRSLYKISSAC